MATNGEDVGDDGGGNIDAVVDDYDYKASANVDTRQRIFYCFEYIKLGVLYFCLLPYYTDTLPFAIRTSLARTQVYVEQN